MEVPKWVGSQSAEMIIVVGMLVRAVTCAAGPCITGLRWIVLTGNDPECQEQPLSTARVADHYERLQSPVQDVRPVERNRLPSISAADGIIVRTGNVANDPEGALHR